jgi:HEAT repeat protein
MSPKSARSSSRPATSAHGFDKELAELEALSEALKASGEPNSAQVEKLHKALTHRNNFLVAKAAKLVAEAELTALLPDILMAFDRFFIDAANSDPKCWAKDALSKALVKLEHRSKDAYLRGLHHRQMEGSWGSPVDSAGTLRATCAHALVNCPGISDAELLTVLLEPLTDPDKSVRIEGARAIAQVGGVSAALILRLRTLLAKEEPEVEVMGAVFSALLSLDGEKAIPLLAGYLETGEDLAAEAAFALADMRTPEALAALTDRLRAGADSWFSSVLLSAIALTRLPQAFNYLMAIIERDAREAPAAIEAIGRSAPNAELIARVQQAVRQIGSSRLEQAMRQYLRTQPE